MTMIEATPDTQTAPPRRRTIHAFCCLAAGHTGNHTTHCGIVKTCTPRRVTNWADRIPADRCVVCLDLLTGDPTLCPEGGKCGRSA